MDVSVTLSQYFMHIITPLKESCEQSIELETAEGAIAIPLKAVLPRVLVSLPESLKFGLCAVQDSLSLEFQISNTRYVCCFLVIHPLWVSR